MSRNVGPADGPVAEQVSRKERPDRLPRHVGRRVFLRRLGLALAGAPLLARFTPARATHVRTLNFHHTHTGETLSVEWAGDGTHDRSTIERVNYFLRDFRTDEAHEIDPDLLDFLAELHGTLDSSGTFEVISGYRSPTTNARLRAGGRGVAKRSLHMEGRAIDVRLTDVDSKTLRDRALALKRGGVGYYPKSDFVHVDTGRYRTW
jgi:uncharacterized protein YcbK (DUF882 family)